MRRFAFLRWCLLLLLSLICGVSVAMAATVPVILSTDVGAEIDDQWAITYLLTQPVFDVRGILSAHTPNLPDPAAHSSYLVLRDVVEHRLGLAVHPPLLEGASLPLEDGAAPRPSAAASFLVEQSKEFSVDHRLNVVVIGAATDVASALLIDPTIVDRISITAMAFKNLSPDGAHEYNEMNDPYAWRVLLASRVPITVGTGDVCQRDLSLNYAQAKTLLHGHGPIAAWLWSEYEAWYFGHVKPLRSNDFSGSWTIWDLITLSSLRGMATTAVVPRPVLDNSMNFHRGAPGAVITSITAVDGKQLWADFTQHLNRFEQTHRVPMTVEAEP